MTLLPFDIETAQFALLTGTGKIVTRNGYSVEITCWDTKMEEDDFPVEGEIYFPLKDISISESWTREGSYNFSSDVEHIYDLFIETDFDL